MDVAIVDLPVPPLVCPETIIAMITPEKISVYGNKKNVAAQELNAGDRKKFHR
jgi:hypothetical protein